MPCPIRIGPEPRTRTVSATFAPLLKRFYGNDHSWNENPIRISDQGYRGGSEPFFLSHSRNLVVVAAVCNNDSRDEVIPLALHTFKEDHFTRVEKFHLLPSESLI